MNEPKFNMKYLAILSLVIFYMNSCSSPELILEEQYFSPEERGLLDRFLAKIDDKVCFNATDESYICFNSHLKKCFQGINTKRDATFKLNALDLINDLDSETFALLFVYFKGQEKKDRWTNPVDRNFLSIKNNGKFMNFADQYCKQSSNEFLKKVWNLSNRFNDPGPKLLSYLYKNASAINHENQMDRLLFSILYVILDYNMTFVTPVN